MTSSKFLFSVSTFLILSVTLPAQSDHFDENYSDLMFVTPTKSTTSLKSSPNSVTKLNSKDLYYLGVQSIDDAMRLVPGMVVSDLYRSEVQIGYHGLNASLPRRQDILYNGSSIYKAGDSGIHWARLPFSVDDLESIEVVRGSSTIDYGSNAMTSAINLIQKPITLESPFFGSLLAGSNDRQELRGGLTFNHEGSYIYLRAFDKKHDGFDSAEGFETFNNEVDAKGVLLSGEHDLGSSTILDWNLSYSDYAFSYPDFSSIGNTGFAAEGADEQTQASVRGAPPGSEENVHATLKLSGSNEHTTWNVASKYSLYDRKQVFNFCNLQLTFLPLFADLDASPNVHIQTQDFPLIFQSGLSTGVVQLNASIVNPLSAEDQALLQQIGAQMQAFGPQRLTEEICGTSSIDTTEERINVSGFIKADVNEKLTYSAGLDFSNTEAVSQTYFKGSVERNTLLFSQNLKYENGDYIVNAGALAEYDNNLDGIIYSPRISTAYTHNDNLTLRGLYSVSRRSPDIHETSRRLQYRINLDEGFQTLLGEDYGQTFRVATSPDNLRPEKVKSTELGFIYVKDRQFLADFKIFHEDFENLISEPFRYLDFNLTNNGKITKQGAELAGSATLGETRFGFGYTYLDWKSNNEFELGLIARHTGNIWSISKLPYDLYLGLAYSGYAGGPNGSYNKTDLTVSKPFKIGSSKIDFQVGINRYPQQITTFSEFSNEFPVRLRYENRNQYFLRLSAEL